MGVVVRPVKSNFICDTAAAGFAIEQKEREKDSSLLLFHILCLYFCYFLLFRGCY